MANTPAKQASGSRPGGPSLPRPAFSCYEIYARVEGIEASRQRLYKHGTALVEAVQSSLANSVMGSGAAGDEIDFDAKVAVLNHL